MEVLMAVFAHGVVIQGWGNKFWDFVGVSYHSVDPTQGWLLVAGASMYLLKVVRWVTCVSHTDTVGIGSALFVIYYHLVAIGSVTLCAFISPYDRLPTSMAVGGITMVFVSLVFEAVADQQLMNFKLAKDLGQPLTTGRVCTAGFWGMSRHPNYMFNCFPFTGMGLLSGCWWLAVAWFGIQVFWAYSQSMPQHEAYCADRYGDEWVEYCAKTPELFPCVKLWK